MNIRNDYRIRVRARGARKRSAVAMGTLLSVTACTSPMDFVPLEIATVDLDPGATGVVYFVDLTAAGGDGVYTWSLQFGAVPPGLTLDPAGAISGTPIEPGASFFTLSVVSGDGQSADRQMLLEVGEGLGAPVLLSPEWGASLDNGCSFDLDRRERPGICVHGQGDAVRLAPSDWTEVTPTGIERFRSSRVGLARLAFTAVADRAGGPRTASVRDHNWTQKTD